jgi:hypothetical protein
MSFGQMSEVLFMVAMPLFFARLGVKWMLVTGMAAWVLRYFLFASAATGGSHALILLGILLHGFARFFRRTGLYRQEIDDDIRGQAQVLVLVTYGVGCFGAQVWGGCSTHSFLIPTSRLVARFWPSWCCTAVMACSS